MQKFIEAVEKELPKYHPKTRAEVVRNVYKAYIDPVGKIKANLGLIKKPTVKDLEEIGEFKKLKLKK